jgi:four helix bundle protein
VTSDEQARREERRVKPPNGYARGYRDLLVWQKGMALVKRIYQLTASFPDTEKFGLTSQMRRAAVSIPSNIAEGQARKSTGEFVQFISNAEGSAAELDTQLQLSVDLGILGPAHAARAFEAVSEIKRMPNGLRRALLKR